MHSVVLHCSGLLPGACNHCNHNLTDGVWCWFESLCALPIPVYSWYWDRRWLFFTSAGLWDALLLWLEHKHSAAAMSNFAVPSCSPILEAVTQLPLKNPPSRALGVTFIAYTGWSSWRNSSLVCRLTMLTGEPSSSLCSCNLYHMFCHLSHKMPSTQSAKSNLS